MRRLGLPEGPLAPGAGGGARGAPGGRRGGGWALGGAGRGARAPHARAQGARRGAEGRRANTLPGITVTGAEAEVRVFPPVPLDGWPKDLAKLQVSGTDLDDPAAPGPVPEGAAVLWLNPDLDMSAGKAMAQAGHGAQLLWWAMSGADRKAWHEAGFPLAVRTATAEDWAGLTSSGLPVVRDAGFTEIAPGSCTVVSAFPNLK
ncbi:peptidyl-tRNA hydrolase [Streptomyces sp. NPDC059082]|uniref:peptidyl-tRNA hydrolase n=1 Tax=Streptomyces sp. NPDC059082 TaxID=3346720 RepID=UPI003698A3EA